ncbi:MAG: hypothetical protein V2J10_11885 [Wenzhouxiangella sp.]|jgi:hypothetical protein|nr:hypothetical protein [Wenzhouxiangella sp.]
MNPARIQAAVDRLVARDGCYRPAALLRLTLRLGPDGSEPERGDGAGFIEDALYGDPARVADMLRLAADWARRLGLQAEVEKPSAAGPRWFRSPDTDRLARTVWQRAVETPQGDLFFDNRFAVARGNLARAVVDGRRDAAEQSLAEMARAGADHEVQADAEHLVGALAWLDGPVVDVARTLEGIDATLAPRAERFLGRRDARSYLARFWRWLAAGMDAATFDPERADGHPSRLYQRLEEPEKVIASVRQVADYQRHPVLLERLANAGLAAGDREAGLSAMCQLCWLHAERAEQWLDRCRDPELARRIEIFWDLDTPLDVALFPAWLVAMAYPLPESTDEGRFDHPAAEATARFRQLRRQPDDRATRAWLQTQQPDLFRLWLRR